ncbi:MAG: response regulator [Gemmatimonadetes bacterium]|nr:response regulator [Gemmatimonadota bacterium]
MARVLVADDNADIRSALRDLLGAAGHDVLHAANGIEAVDLALSRNPDLLLLDLMMPRADGMEVLRRLKAFDATRRLPVIVITALRGQREMLDALECGVCSFITKPWQPGEVEGQVAWALQAAAREKAGRPLPAAWAPIRGKLLIG